ncbi:MAG: Hint domain-containing protein [Pseudomonadota bacterium]
MASSLYGAYLVPWSQTTVDGMVGAPVGRLEFGVAWSWRGFAQPLDVKLESGVRAVSDADLQMAIRQIVGRHLAALDLGEDPTTERAFTVSDGRRRYEARLIDVAELARPLILFSGALPPAGQQLRVVEVAGTVAEVHRLTDQPTGVICFSAGTQLLTPDGLKRVEDLSEGDRVQTKDDGAQEILWIGSRRMSGARLHAMPELRPVRIRTGAIDGTTPAPDLIVSPRHRLVLKGKIANALFGTPEVLVTARDLLDDRGILIDRTLTDVTYVHILLPRHQVVWANGVESESFHPASTDLETVLEDQRARLLAAVPGIDIDPGSYGPAARKPLSAKEAVVFAADVRTHH